jgi:Arc/MetJ-type ribon-helix-helix transcriptional regulator
MKLSISVPDEQMELLDRIVEQRCLASRSAAIQEAIDLLLNNALVADYKAAFADWDDTADATNWDAVAGDGLEPEKPWW